MATRKIFNSNTQKTEDAELTVDQNNEIVATFADETFIKFPAGLTADAFDELIKLEETRNKDSQRSPEVLAAINAERENSLALIGEAPVSNEIKVEVKEDNGDTTPEAEQSNADQPSDQPEQTANN